MGYGYYESGDFHKVKIYGYFFINGGGEENAKNQDIYIFILSLTQISIRNGKINS